MESPIRLMKFHLFNCDNTYKLDSVETFVHKMAVDHSRLKILVEKRYFPLQQMSEISQTTIPKLQMDFAILVVHAHESRLSINEDNAGIGYARFYRALLKATGGKVLIVIGGDDNYQGEDEEDQVVISRWARRKVASQFDEEYLDGRKSFIFSWDRQHREIHEKALLHYFDSSKKGQKFQYVPKLRPAKAKPKPVSTITAPAATGEDKDEYVEVESRSGNGSPRRRSKDQGKVSLEENSFREPGSEAVDDPTNYLEGTVLLDTVMRFGEISYGKKDVKVWDQRWVPSEKAVQDLSRDWMLRPLAKVKFVTNALGGVSYSVRPQSILSWLSDIFIVFILDSLRLKFEEFVTNAVGWVSYSVRPQSIWRWLSDILIACMLGCVSLGKDCVVWMSCCMLGILSWCFEWLEEKFNKLIVNR